jgi:hypothetical protein
MRDFDDADQAEQCFLVEFVVISATTQICSAVVLS